MLVFLGVLICKLTYLRTQVRTVSVRMCAYSHTTNFTETDPSVQTGTIVEVVKGPRYAGASRAARDHGIVSSKFQWRE